MMNIKTTWFYSILFLSILGSGGAGYVTAKGDVDKAIMQAHQAAQECLAGRERGNVLEKGPIYNSKDKGY